MNDIHEVIAFQKFSGIRLSVMVAILVATANTSSVCHGIPKPTFYNAQCFNSPAGHIPTSSEVQADQKGWIIENANTKSYKNTCICLSKGAVRWHLHRKWVRVRDQSLK